MNWRGRLASWLVGGDQAAIATAMNGRVLPISGKSMAVAGDGVDPEFWRGSADSGWSNYYPSMRTGTAYACGRIVASSGASLPCNLFERTGQDRRVVARSERLHRLVHDSPNADQTAFEYWEGVFLSLMFAGDHIARIERAGNGDIVALNPVDARLVSVTRSASGQRRYRWSENGRSHDLTEDGVFHIRGFGGDALRGRSVISYGASTLRRSRNVETAADTVFANGIRPSGVFEVEKFLTEEQFTHFIERVADRFAGAENVGRPLILEGGTKFNALQMSNEDAQLLESRGFSVEEICRIFGVPPFMVGHTEKSTSWGTGIEQQLLGFQKFTLTPYLRRVEQAISKQLIRPERRERFYAEFNLEGILRADSKARGEFYERMTRIGAMTVNEVRAKENLEPIEGGDVARVQMQNVPLTETGEGTVE
jgi:HK97 family phage portal protein